MGKLTYYVARHVADRIRNEPRNIGVVVTDGARLCARFMGETSKAATLDLRRVPTSVVNDRVLYQEWHKAWRRTLGSLACRQVPAANRTETPVVAGTVENRIASLTSDPSSAFRIELGGEWYLEAEELPDADVSRVTDDIYRRVVDALAQTLTDPAGVATIPNGTRAPARSIELAELIAAEFRQRNILAGSENRLLFAAHPVRVDQLVVGRNPVPHVPKFVQDNGQRWVIEHVDFDVTEAEASREHAAYAAYLLNDVQKAPQVRAATDPATVVSIAVVNRVAAAQARVEASAEVDALLEAQEYGLAVLAEHPDVRVVHWDDIRDRQRFLEERVAVATGEAH